MARRKARKKEESSLRVPGRCGTCTTQQIDGLRWLSQAPGAFTSAAAQALGREVESSHVLCKNMQARGHCQHSSHTMDDRDCSKSTASRCIHGALYRLGGAPSGLLSILCKHRILLPCGIIRPFPATAIVTVASSLRLMIGNGLRCRSRAHGLHRSESHPKSPAISAAIDIALL